MTNIEIRDAVRDLAHNQLRIALLALAAGESFADAVAIARTFAPRCDTVSEMRVWWEPRLSAKGGA